jgi:GDP-4-dehydro-6-deoxy-D-mannose reductase
MKILVTGAGGFVGNYLLRLLLEHKHTVIAMGVGNGAFLKELHIPTYEVNIVDYKAVFQCLQQVMPDAVIHLAAISNVPMSWNKPTLTAEVNIVGTINVLQALAEVNKKAKFLNIGSSDEYGLAAKIGKPLTEDVFCQPQNPYSISKYCAEQMVLQLGKKDGMRVIHVRPFNHFGPGQAKGFATTDFASQIADIEAGKQEPIIKVGDLSAYRDFTFVADVVAAYVALVEKDVASGVYNICSGKARKVEEILTTLVSLSTEKIKIEVDRSKFRIAEVPFFVGNCDKLKKATGWNPVYDFEHGMMEVLEYWRY